MHYGPTVGKYAYTRLPIGIACAPDIFQSIVMDLLGDLDFVLAYIDGIIIVQKVGESEADHIKLIEQVLTRLEAKGFWVNLRKSFFMQKEVEYLEYLLSTGGLKPQPEKSKQYTVSCVQRTQNNWRCFLAWWISIEICSQNVLVS